MGLFFDVAVNLGPADAARLGGDKIATILELTVGSTAVQAFNQVKAQFTAKFGLTDTITLRSVKLIKFPANVVLRPIDPSADPEATLLTLFDTTPNVARHLAQAQAVKRGG